MRLMSVPDPPPHCAECATRPAEFVLVIGAGRQAGLCAICARLIVDMLTANIEPKGVSE